MSEPKNELGYGDVAARPDVDGAPAADNPKPAAMNNSGHSVGTNDEAPPPAKPA